MHLSREVNLSPGRNPLMISFNFLVNEQDVNDFNSFMDQFAEDIRNKVLRSGCKAATDVYKQHFQDVASGHRSKNNPPLRRLPTGGYAARRHLADSFTTKIWKIPDNTGFVGFAGPASFDAPHGHLLEEGTGDRYTKDGKWRGAMPAFHLMKLAVARGLFQAEDAFFQAAESKLRSIGVIE